jgi:hypothetical protein
MKKSIGMTLALLWAACSPTHDLQSGTTDETSTVCGKVTYSNGTPAADVSLKIFQDSAVAPLRQAGTASDGTFNFDSLAPGAYGISAEGGDSVVAYAGSILVHPQELVTRNLTLEPASSLTAYVRLQGGENPHTVLVQTLGIDKTARPDSATGKFTIKKLARGGYALRLSTTVSGYSAIYKPFTISSGVTDTLKDNIVFTLRNPCPTCERLTAITYGNGRFVAVGYKGMIITSQNGVNWSMASNSGRNLNSVAWGNGLFVTVGDSCGTMTSMDGINWTPYTLLPMGPCSTSALRCATYGNNQFIVAGSTYDRRSGAMGNYSVVFTSADGIAWKERPADQSIPLNALTYGNSTFVGVGGNRALVSSDGIKWAPYSVELSTDAAFATSLETVMWGGNQFVALGMGGGLYLSPNGEKWTKQDARIGDADLVGAIWQDNHYTIIGNKNNWPDPDTIKIARSSDGKSWTSFFGWTSPLSATSVTALSYGTGAYIAIGTNGLIASSIDGINWKNRSSITTEILNDVCWNSGQFVAVGRSGTVLSSMDGIGWNLGSSGTTNDLRAIACGNNRFVAIGAGGVICGSASGADWTPASSPTPNDLSGIVWGNGRFVAVGEKKIVLSSVDGKKWEISLPSVDTMRAAIQTSVAYGKYGFVTVNSFGEMFTSADGLTWKIGNAARNGNYRGVAWGADKYVVIGQRCCPDTAFFLTSPDGQVWASAQPITWAPSLNPIKISWGADQFVILDKNGPSASVYSADGLTWFLVSDPSAIQGFNALAWDGKQYVFVGDYGAIATCPPF